MHLPHSIQSDPLKTHLSSSFLTKTFQGPPISSRTKSTLLSMACEFCLGPCHLSDLNTQFTLLPPFCSRKREPKLILGAVLFHTLLTKLIMLTLPQKLFSPLWLLQDILQDPAAWWKSLFSATFPEPQVELISPFFVTYCTLYGVLPLTL